MHFVSENEHGTCTRALSRKRERRGHHFMRACAVEMDMRNSKSNFCASRPTQNAETTRANPDLNPLNSYRKNPLVRSTIWGKSGNPIHSSKLEPAYLQQIGPSAQLGSGRAWASREHLLFLFSGAQSLPTKKGSLQTDCTATKFHTVKFRSTTTEKAPNFDPIWSFCTPIERLQIAIKFGAFVSPINLDRFASI